MGKWKEERKRVMVNGSCVERERERDIYMLSF
jgi:hypothetical protein